MEKESSSLLFQSFSSSSGSVLDQKTWSTVYIFYSIINYFILIIVALRLTFLAALKYQMKRVRPGEMSWADSGVDLGPKIFFFSVMCFSRLTTAVCYTVLAYIFNTEHIEHGLAPDKPSHVFVTVFHYVASLGFSLMVVVLISIWSKTLQMAHGQYKENNVHPRRPYFAKFCRLPVKSSLALRIGTFILFGALAIVIVVCLIYFGVDREKESDMYGLEINVIRFALAFCYIPCGIVLVVKSILIGCLYEQEGSCMDPHQIKVIVMGIPAGLLLIARGLKEMIYTLLDENRYQSSGWIFFTYMMLFDVGPSLLLVFLMWPVPQRKEEDRSLISDEERMERLYGKKRGSSYKAPTRMHYLPDGPGGDDLSESDDQTSDITEALNRYEDESRYQNRKKLFNW